MVIPRTKLRTQKSVLQTVYKWPSCVRRHNIVHQPDRRRSNTISMARCQRVIDNIASLYGHYFEQFLSV